MTVNKFGTHILKQEQETGSYYYCILPIIVDYEKDTPKEIDLLVNYANYFTFPLSEAEVKSVQCHSNVSFKINDKGINAEQLEGYNLKLGDKIGVTKKYLAELPKKVFITLVLKCKINDDDDE